MEAALAEEIDDLAEPEDGHRDPDQATSIREHIDQQAREDSSFNTPMTMLLCRLLTRRLV